MNQFPIWSRICPQSWLFLGNFWEMWCLANFKILKKNIKSTSTLNIYRKLALLCFWSYLSYSSFIKRKNPKNTLQNFEKTRIKTSRSLSPWTLTVPLSVRPSVHTVRHINWNDTWQRGISAFITCESIVLRAIKIFSKTCCYHIIQLGKKWLYIAS